MKSRFPRLGRHHHACDAFLVAAGRSVACADAAFYPMCDLHLRAAAATLGACIQDIIEEVRA